MVDNKQQLINNVIRVLVTIIYTLVTTIYAELFRRSFFLILLISNLLGGIQCALDS